MDSVSPPPRKSSLVIIVRWLLITGLWIITVVVLLYAFENWRGARSLAALKQKLVQAGEVLDPTAFVPAPVPDAENFAQTPFLAPLFDFLPDSQQRRDEEQWRAKTSWGNEFKPDRTWCVHPPC